MLNRLSEHNTLNVLRSFLPESTIISHAYDLDARIALAFKYEAENSPEHSSRILALAAFAGLRYSEPRPGEWIWLGDAAIETDYPSPIAAHDLNADAKLDRESLSATLLHTDNIRGAEDARKQLGTAAEYIAAHPNIRETPYVVGATYSELARFGVRMGMRQMEITDIDRKFEALLRASHRWTFANSRTHHAFKSAAVYLPTDEFVARFIPEKHVGTA